MSGIDGEYSAAEGMVIGERSGTEGGRPAFKVPYLGRTAYAPVRKSNTKEVRRVSSTTCDIVRLRAVSRRFGKK